MLSLYLVEPLIVSWAFVFCVHFQYSAQKSGAGLEIRSLLSIFSLPLRDGSK